jgi:pyruvate/2-oxoglutarate dehydrogenase complex dihydrolipoamide acyltransferase (E2) component
MAAIEVKVPDIGDFKDVAVIELLVKPGDRVAVDQSLVTVESDKASMEIPSSAAGVVKELRVKLGDKVNQGSPLVVLEGEAPRRHRLNPPLPPRRHRQPQGPRQHSRQPQPQPQHRRPRRWPRATAAASISNAICWCWAAGRAATRLRSALPTSA